MSTTSAEAVSDQELLERILDRVTMNLTMLLDREVKLHGVDAERATKRPAGRDQIHISARLAVRHDNELVGEGCLLFPLPEAISMACYLMMLPDSEVASWREERHLDETMKEAVLEVGSIVSSAVDEALRIFEVRLRCRYRGCQGVRADVRPALEYEEGSELMVARGLVSLHEGEPFEVILMVPPLMDGQAAGRF